MANGQGPPDDVPGRAEPFDDLPKGLDINASPNAVRQYQDPRTGSWRKIEIISTKRNGGQIIQWKTIE